MENLSQQQKRLRHDAEDAANKVSALLVSAQKSAESILHGNHAKRKSGSGEKFWQFREYTPFDRPQDIDWRQTAKADRLYIREKEKQTSQTALVWASNTPDMDFRSDHKLPTKKEAANTLTLALSILFVHNGENVMHPAAGLAGHTENTLERIAHALCSDRPAQNEFPVEAINGLKKNAMCFLAGDFISPLENAVDVLKKISEKSPYGMFIQVLDPAEIHLPYRGRAIFQKPSAKESTEVENITDIRDVYKKRIADHIDVLNQTCLQHGWDHVLHETGTPIAKTLEDIWLKIHMRNTSVFNGAPI